MKRKATQYGWIRIIGNHDRWKKVMECYHDDRDDFYWGQLREIERKIRETTTLETSAILLPVNETPSFGGILSGR